MEKEIKELLNQYSEALEILGGLEKEKRELLETVIPHDIKVKIEDIEVEFKANISRFQENLEYLRSSIKEAVIQYGCTVRGDKHMGVYVKSKVSWDDSFLLGLATTIPQILGARKESSPSIQIRELK